jgi:hypothetical protein
VIINIIITYFCLNIQLKRELKLPTKRVFLPSLGLISKKVKKSVFFQISKWGPFPQTLERARKSGVRMRKKRRGWSRSIQRSKNEKKTQKNWIEKKTQQIGFE